MKVLLVDDEALALDFLEFQLNKIDHIDAIRKVTYLDIEKSTSLLEGIDVLFLDIEMPEMNGIELAEKILEINADISIVFVTAFKQYAVQAFELNALDYILKPLEFERLKKTWNRVKKNVNQSVEQPKSIAENHTLRINVSRELSFEFIPGNPELIHWRTTKSQELFLYLLHHQNETVRKSKLIELFWTEFDQDRAYSQLYTAIYHLRKTLKKFHDHFLIKNVGEGYNLTTKNVYIDLQEWESRISTLPPIHKDTIHDYELCMQLYRGAYLKENDYLWAEGERYRLEQLWLRVAHQMGNYYSQENDNKSAEIWYLKICTAQPEDENAHFSLMKLFNSQKRGVLVSRQYQKLEKALQEIGVEISPNVRRWYKQWERDSRFVGERC